MTCISWSSDFALFLRLFSDFELYPLFFACSGLLKFDMTMFVNVARLDIGQLTKSMRRGHPYTLDTFLVSFNINAHF